MISHMPQLILWIRYEANNGFQVLLLLRNTTYGEYIYVALKECLSENSIDIERASIDYNKFCSSNG